jgi:hypothetical protein
MIGKIARGAYLLINCGDDRGTDPVAGQERGAQSA